MSGGAHNPAPLELTGDHERNVWLWEWRARDGTVNRKRCIIVPHGADGAKAQLLFHFNRMNTLPVVVLDEPREISLEGDTLVVFANDRTLRLRSMGPDEGAARELSHAILPVAAARRQGTAE